jgi:hypothetical protein
MRAISLAFCVVAACLLAAVAESNEPVAIGFHDAPPPVRTAPAGFPPALADVFSRLTDAERHRDPMDPADLVTWTHECTHGVSALAQNRHRQGDRQTIYLLDGRCVTLRHPRVTIGEVATLVPADLRTGRAAGMFRNYMVDQRTYWDDQPLYLLEEWISYTHGAIARRQAGITTRSDTEWRADVMEEYVVAMLALARKRDPGYGDFDILADLIAWNSARVRAGRPDVETSPRKVR